MSRNNNKTDNESSDRKLENTGVLNLSGDIVQGDKNINIYVDGEQDSHKTKRQFTDKKMMLTEDPNLSEDEIRILTSSFLSDSDGDNDIQKEKVNKAFQKWIAFHDGLRGIIGRKAVCQIEYRGTEYHVYDVFLYQQKKYAFAIRSTATPLDQQSGAFFHIGAGGEWELYFDLSSLSCDLFSSNDYYAFFIWYTVARRGLGVLPDVLYDIFAENFRKVLDAGYLKEVYSWMQLQNLDNDCVSHFDLELFQKCTQKLLYPHITGNYNNIGIWIGQGNCFGNTFQGYYAGKLIKTPIKNNVILDIVSLQMPNMYLALTYRTRKSLFLQIKYIVEGPEYFLITKNKADGSLSFSKIAKENIEFYCKPYYDRFALIYMQAKMITPSVFLQNNNQETV